MQHLNIMYSNIDVFKFRDISEIQKLKILSVFTDTSKVIVKDVLEKLEKIILFLRNLLIPLLVLFKPLTI